MSSTHFGFQSVDETQKAQRVRSVFDSVAPKYDLMNDLMSMGLHRAWKAYTVMVANLREGDKVLDIAGGTGDLAMAFAKRVGKSGQVIHTDINEAMLRTGRNRLLDAGVTLPTLVCDAEKLPFADNYFDLVSVAFGLRNMTRLWKKSTTGTRSKSCRSWESWWPGMTPVTATWQSPFACTRTRPN